MGLLIRFFICLAFATLLLYKSIDNLNELTELQLALPSLEKEVQEAREMNLQLEYDIEKFENPLHLMELAQQPQYSHLKSPTLTDIIVLQQGEP